MGNNFVGGEGDVVEAGKVMESDCLWQQRTRNAHQHTGHTQKGPSRGVCCTGTGAGERKEGEPEQLPPVKPCAVNRMQKVQSINGNAECRVRFPGHHLCMLPNSGRAVI